MKFAAAIAITGALAISLSACAGKKRPGPPMQIIDRALKSAPGAAQPSTIVATEIAFARMAKEQGQWTAFREFAAPGAMLHGQNGGIPAMAWLAELADPAQSVEWAPRTVVMSCDGAVAVSQGRYRDPEGLVGNFITVWERQADNSYKWVYDVGGPDVPQPPPRKEFEDGNIVVTAIDAVQGLVATCPRGGETVPPPPANSPVGERAVDAKLSKDGTLRWRWQHRGKNEKYVAAEYYYNGQWVTAIEESLASSIEE